jgi:DNA-binding HxlR family transcriptional regulator
MKRKSLEHAACPIARSLDEIGEWWSLLIVRDAALGKRRFGEFHKSLGLAKNVLAARLKKMVDRGIFEMVPAADGSGRQEYQLTAKGNELRMVLVALRLWGGRWLFAKEGRTLTLVDPASGEEVALQLRTETGRRVTPGGLVPRVRRRARAGIRS